MSGLFQKGASAMLMRSVAFVSVLGLLVSGCPDSKPTPPDGGTSTAEEQAKDLLAKAKIAFEKGDLDGAEKDAKAALKLKADAPGSKDLLDQIQEERVKGEADKRQKEIDSILAKAKTAFDAKKYEDAIAECDKVLQIDAGQPEAVALKEKAKAAMKPAGPDHAKLYKEISGQIDDAKGKREWDTAVDLIKKLEEHVGDDRASRQGEVAEIEAEKLIEQAAAKEARANDVAGLSEAKNLYEQAAGKKDSPRVRGMIAKVDQKIEAVNQRMAAEKRAGEAVSRATAMEEAGQFSEALRLLRQAQQDARSDPRLQRTIREAMVRINTALGYQTAIDAGDQKMVKGDYDGALGEYQKAQRIKDTPEVRTKILGAEAVGAEENAKAAVAAGDLEKAIAEFERAYGLRPTAEIATALEKAKGDKARKDYLTAVANAKAMRAQLNFRDAMPALESLAAKYPDWTEAGELLAVGISKEETTKIDAQAKSVNDALQTQLKAKGMTSAKKIAAIEAAMPKITGSRYEKAVSASLTREKDAMAKGKYDDLTKKLADKKLKSPDKVAMMEAALSGFAGSSYADKIASSIKTEKDNIARPQYTALQVKLGDKKLKPQDKIQMIDAELPKYAGTSFADQLEAAKKREKDAILKGEFTKLNAVLKGLKDDRAKIAKIVQDMPKYAGSSYEAQLKKMHETALNSMKAADFNKLRTQIKAHKTSQLKIDELTKRLPEFAGSRYEPQIQKMIDAEKSAQVVGWYKDLNKALKTEKDPDKKIKRLETELPRFAKTKYEKKVAGMLQQAKTNKVKDKFTMVNNKAKGMKSAKTKVVYLQAELGQFKGTSYAKQLQKMIDTEKGKVAAEEKMAKEKAADAEYKAVMAVVKKNATKFDDNIKALTEAKGKVSGTKYVEMIQKEITNQQKAKEKAQPKPKAEKK